MKNPPPTLDAPMSNSPSVRHHPDRGARITGHPAAFLLAGTAIFTLWQPTACAATVFNASTGFSETANTSSSTWSYWGKSDHLRNGSYYLLSDFLALPSFPGLSVWGTPQENYLAPLIGINRSGSNRTSGPILWPSNSLYLHPGPGGMVILSWLSDGAYILDIDFQVSDADAVDGDGISWFVERNSGADTIVSGTLANGGSTSQITASNVAVQAGDRINFVIDSLSGYDYDSTMLTASISATPVPEVSTFMALVSGIGLPAVIRHRRRS